MASLTAPAKDGRFLHRVEGLELGTHRFRLRQEDEAGNVTFSEIVEVKVEMAEQFLLDPVYPNPFNPQATVRFAVKEQEEVRIELYNALGQGVGSHAGLIFRLVRNTFCGSHLAFTSARRPSPGPRAISMRS